jgi:nitrogen fixation protein FixH
VNINRIQKTVAMSTSKITHTGNILIAGFGGMLLMISVLVYLAMKEDVTMVSKNYYEQELAYQDKMRAAANTDAYAAPFRAQLKNEEIQISIPEALSKNIQNGMVEFYCPSSDKWDKKYVLETSATGLYSFRTSALEGPAYTIKLSFIAEGKEFYKQWKYNRAHAVLE